MGQGRKLSASETLLRLIDLTTMALEELQADPDETQSPQRWYERGAKAAYVTCLEVMKMWEEAEENGLDFDIEENFPV